MKTIRLGLLGLIIISFATSAIAMKHPTLYSRSETFRFTHEKLNRFTVKNDRGNITVCGIPLLPYIIVTIIKQADNFDDLQSLDHSIKTDISDPVDANLIIHGKLKKKNYKNPEEEARASISLLIRFPSYLAINKTFFAKDGTITLKNLYGDTFAETENGSIKATEMGEHYVHCSLSETYKNPPLHLAEQLFGSLVKNIIPS
jgi:hypothetical protein